MLRLYDFWESGNCYKVRLVLAQLGIDYERVAIDILKGESRTADYLEKNPNGRVPLLEWPDGRTLAESNAIIWHLATDTPLLPRDDWHRAKVLEWLGFEQYSHEPYIAVLRFWHFSGQLDDHRDEIEAKAERGHAALAVMENHLAENDYFVGDRYSIADVALYAYTHVADEGGFDLSRYPAIRAWLERVASQPDHVRIDAGQPAGH